MREWGENRIFILAKITLVFVNVLEESYLN